MPKRIGKAKGTFAKHLQKGVGSSRKRNMKRQNNKTSRQLAKKEMRSK